MQMSVETETSALSMSESINSLNLTPLVMHRIWFELRDVNQWYAIMKEARTLYGFGNWKGQGRVKRRLKSAWRMPQSYLIWFDVPDPTFGTWCAVKHTVIVAKNSGK